ncbi:MAG: HAD-IA family hydrolase [Myxococcota bacterium]
MIRAVLFDAVGTLIELREPVGETYARAAAEQGVEICPWRMGDAFRRIIASAGPLVFPDAEPIELPALERGWWRQVVRSTFLAADSARRVPDFDACFEGLWRHFGSPAAWRLRDGAAEVLSRLRESGLRTGIVSNFDGRLPALLQGLGLAALVDAVVLPSDAGAAKPDARIFQLALRRVGAAPSEAIFVGDDAEHDLEGAREAGLKAVDAAALATLRDLHVP